MQERKPVSRIALLREQTGLTQLELAQRLDVTENTIANWEKGRSALAWIIRVIKLCEIFQCTPDQLIEYVAETVPVEKKPKKSQIMSAECPMCGKHSIVQRSENVYLCLACGFKKDLNPPPPKPASIFGTLFAPKIGAKEGDTTNETCSDGESSP